MAYLIEKVSEFSAQPLYVGWMKSDASISTTYDWIGIF